MLLLLNRVPQIWLGVYLVPYVTVKEVSGKGHVKCTKTKIHQKPHLLKKPLPLCPLCLPLSVNGIRKQLHVCLNHHVLINLPPLSLESDIICEQSLIVFIIFLYRCSIWNEMLSICFKMTILNIRRFLSTINGISGTMINQNVHAIHIVLCTKTKENSGWQNSYAIYLIHDSLNPSIIWYSLKFSCCWCPL